MNPVLPLDPDTAEVAFLVADDVHGLGLGSLLLGHLAAACSSVGINSFAARSLRTLLYPGSVAVVGVRREGSGIGGAVLSSIQAGGFTGPSSTGWARPIKNGSVQR